MKEESHNPSTDPELEARIVALVLGEASDFERDELNRLIEKRPELATLKEQIQSVHGLLQDVGTGESLQDDSDWKLSAEKRSAVLAVIGGDAEKQLAKQSLDKLAEKRRSVKWNSFRNLTKIAAVFCFVGLSGSIAILAFFNYGSTDSARSRRLASNVASSRDSQDASEHFWGDGPAASRDFYLMDGASTEAADEGKLGKAKPATAAGFDSEKNSKSALGAIRGALDFDVASTTEGVNGPEPSPPQTSGYPGVVANEETRQLGELDGDGDRRTGSQPTGQEAGNGELSFPRFSIRTGELNALDPAEPVGSTVSVPDEGTILLGGIKRLADGRGEPGTSGEPTLSSPMTHEYANSDSGGETQDAATGRDRVLVEEWPVLERQSVRPGLAALDEIEKSRDDHRQSLSEFDDALDAGEDKNFDGFVADGESLGGGGFGGGMGSTGARSNESSAKQKPQGVSREESSAWRDSLRSEETSPSQPMAAGKGDRPETTDANAFYDSKVPGTARSAKPMPSPTKKLTAPTEGFKSKGKLAVDDRYEKEDRYREKSRKERVTTSPSDEDITHSNSRTLDQDKSIDAQIFSPMTDTAEFQPRGGREAGWAKQDNEWGVGQVPEGDSGRDGQDFGTSPSVKFREMEQTDQRGTITRTDTPHEIEKRVKNSLGKISAHTELHRNTDIAGDLLFEDYGKDVDQLWARPQSEPKDEQGGLLRRRGQLAIAGENQWYGYFSAVSEDNSESMKKWASKKSAATEGLNEKSAEVEAFSTFSLHVSDVSFKLARAALAHGEWPEAAKVRIEEFVNAFDYGDPMPSQSEKVSCRLEQSIHPFLQQRNLLRVSMRTAAAGRSSNTPLRLTFVLDNSGSMERTDRQETVRRAFALLAQQLKPIDQVTLISFARQPRLLADKVSGAQSRQLVELIRDLPSEGGTNIEAALQLAFEKAREQRVDDAQNRIILLTDGAVNLGDANPDSLSKMITTMRNAGIAFDAAGISAEGLNDEILEALTRKGDGRYYLLDFPEAADDGFVRQIAGALRPSAKNVKVQIEFNPERVGRYKLLGFEKHRLKQEDFRNDQVDAAEMAAAEAGVAVYQFEAKPDGEGDVGSVSVRFRDLSTGQMIENCWPIPYEADAPRPDQAAPSLRIATSAALLAAKLRGEPLGESVDLEALSKLIAGLPDRDRNADRVQQLQLMIQQARQVSGK